MRWKLRQMKREENPESPTHNLTIDSIGWQIPKYHTSRLVKDSIYNLAKKVYSLDNTEYAVKLFAFPAEYEVKEKIEEIENMFLLLQRKIK